MTQHQLQAQDMLQDGKVVLDAAKLKALRKRRGLSQDSLAQLCMENRLCVSIASIKRAETGKPVLYRTASHLARVYVLPLDDIVASSSPAGPALPGDLSEQRAVLGLSIVTAAALPAALEEQVRQLIHHSGGQYNGDGFAVFGLPRAYGSDAVRCVHCAAALAQLLRTQCAALLVRHISWPCQPSALPAATQLIPASAGAAVYVEPGVSAQLNARFGFAQDGAAHGWLRLLGEADADARAARSQHYPLIARHVELQQFKATLDTTSTYQAGHILYLRGVAGIGKSRLIAEFAEIAHQSDFDCHSAVVLDFGTHDDGPPLGQLVRSLLGLRAAASAETELLARMHAAHLPPELAMHYRTILGMPQPAPDAAVYAAMSHQTRAQAQVEALRELILRRAIARPVLLILEDIHWGSPELIATLAALLQDVQEAPVIWVLSSRFEHDPLEATLRPYLNGVPITLLDLGTLRRQEALALAQLASGVDAEFHAQCVARAQGNPLFLTQLLLSGRSETLPGSLRNLVQTKLDQLSSQERQALRIASAIGQYFTLALVRRVLGQPDHDMGVAVRQCIVRPSEPGSYGFVHDLVLQGIYESMPEPQRAAIHAALAECYRFADARLRAGHLDKARHPDAPAAFLEAIGERMAAYQYQQALELIAACRRIEYAPLDEFQLYYLSGECHAKMGQTQLAKAQFGYARDVARTQAQRVSAVVGLARALNVLEEMEEEATLLDQTIASVRASGKDDGLAELYYLKGNMYFPAGDFAMSRQLHELAQRHARSRDTEARSLSGIGDSYYAEGRMVTAHRVFSQCVELCERHGLAEIEASNRFMLGTARIYLNQTQDALADALASAELGRKVGNRRAEIVSRLTAGWAHISLGETSAAREQVELGLALARQIGASRFEPFLNESLVRILVMEDRAVEAHELALQAWDMVQRQKLHRFIGPWVLATLALVEPVAKARAAVLEQAETILAGGCVAHNIYRYHVGAIETRLLHGELEAAQALAERFEERVRAEPCPWALHHVALARACAGWLAAPVAGAEAPLTRLLAEGDAAGLGWVMPRLRQRLAQVLRWT